MHNNFRQTNAVRKKFVTQALCLEHQGRILQQTEELVGTHFMEDPYFEFKN